MARTSLALALVACFLAVLATCEVVDLTDANFAEKTQEGSWFIKFFAPWCGHCKKLAPAWEHLGKELAGKANIGKVDCTQQKDTCSKYGVKGYPTLKLLQGGEEKEKYSGARTIPAFVSFLKEHAGLAADVEVAELPAAAPAEKKPKAEAAPEQPKGPSNVVDLTAENFAEKIKEGHWLIKFYAPWCGHCKKLAPTWDHISNELKGKVNIAKVDCTVHNAICGENGVRGYPTLKLFKDGEEVEKYSGGRDTKAFERYFKEKGIIEESFSIKPLGNEPAKPAAQKNEAQAPPAKEEGPTDVVILSDSDFAEKTKEGSWFVKFYAPWCGHCKKLEPEYTALGEEWSSNDNVVIAKVDSTENDAKGVSISGFPTLMLWKAGATEPITYSGGRTQAELSKWLVEETGEAPDAGSADKDEL